MSQVRRKYKFDRIGQAENNHNYIIYISNRIQSSPASRRRGYQQDLHEAHIRRPTLKYTSIRVKREQKKCEFTINLIGPDEHTAEKRILLPFIFADLDPFFSNSTIYSDLGLNGKENANIPQS